MKLSQKLLGVVLLGSLGFFNQSCSNTEIGAGVGAAVGGIIGNNIDNSRSRPSRCYNCYRPNRRYSYDIENASVITSTGVDEVATVATKYNISYEASGLIVSSLHKAEQQDYSGLKDLGLSTKDVVAVYNNQSLKPETIDALGQNLKMDASHTSALVEKMTADIQAEKALIDSQNL